MASAVTRKPLAVLAGGIGLVAASIILVRRDVPAPTDAGALPVVVTSYVTVAAPAPTRPPIAPVVTTRTGASSAPTATPRPTRPSPAGIRSSSAGTRPTGQSTSATAEANLGEPATLHLPSLGVTAAIQQVDSQHGVLQVPENIAEVGWWRHSVPAGSSVGSTVVDGHIDSAKDGEGALFHLADLGPGDKVAVTTSTGRVVDYRVDARRVYVKAAGLPADLFDQHGPPRLVLISCGGDFDRSTGSYEENIAVFASPVS